MIKRLLSIFRESSNSFDGQEKGEQVALLLRQHPFVILFRIGLFGLVALAPIVVWIIFFSYLEMYSWLNIFFFASSIWYLGLWFAIFYSLTIYTLNTVIITDHRILDRDQLGFFNRKIAELQIYRIQDISTHTSGIIETFLHFGDLTVQTAGSEKQFIFHQIPNPDQTREAIMQIARSKDSWAKTVNNL